jgi:hypothetical protein
LHAVNLWPTKGTAYDLFYQFQIHFHIINIDSSDPYLYLIAYFYGPSASFGEGLQTVVGNDEWFEQISKLYQAIYATIFETHKEPSVDHATHNAAERFPNMSGYKFDLLKFDGVTLRFLGSFFLVANVFTLGL